MDVKSLTNPKRQSLKGVWIECSEEPLDFCSQIKTEVGSPSIYSKLACDQTREGVD
jgi:hypothetical protein